MNVNPMDFLKNFQNIQSKLNEAQERMKDVIAVGSAGGDMVRVTINGQMEVQKVEISPEAVDPSDIEMLQDLVLAAFTNAMEKVKEEIKQQMSSLTGGMDLPPGMFGG
ncbi:MAG: YbaB/EbfC family nucleoid-associated protein [Spirochaetaceae bacterium]|nr:MAG: YbaB/EbfC family nucleoid-associated protein [Spirochaetaceae bacterium]